MIYGNTACSSVWIKLQVVLELITNDTAKALLNLQVQQALKMQNAIYQSRLALDYLLTQERGVNG